MAVEGDWSNAAFWLCAGAIGTDPITVEGVSLSSAQGDRNVLAALSRFGARIVRSTNAATVQSDKLAGFEMSAHDIPDLVPLSLPWHRWRKAARSSAIAPACASRNPTVWPPPPASSPHWARRYALPATTSSSRRRCLYRRRGRFAQRPPHRMMAAIAASRATGEVVIHGAEAVNKSYPDFFDHYRLLGGKVTLEEE